MSTQAIAFFIGFFGSVHCIGMCGPLIFSVPTFKTTRFFMITDKVVYQLGRIVTYTLLGVLLGFVGQQVWIAKVQQMVSIVTGVGILLAGGMRLFHFSPEVSLPLFTSINTLIRYAYQHKANHLIMGILNGFLPCGLVYLALATALNQGGVYQSATYMFWFGLGTTPLVLLAAVGLSFFRPFYTLIYAKLIPILMILLGAWFLLRGLELNIPYLSPAPMASSDPNCA